MRDKARMSALPVLQYCGQSQRLGESLGAGRAAAIGTAFHAKCSNHPDTANIIARLSDEEIEDLDTLIKPTDVEIGNITLTYEMATKERPVAIDAMGCYVHYDDTAALVRGTPDFYWKVVENGRTTIYVADIKRSAYATPDGAASLQVIGYALALVSENHADGYCTGIWDATEGQWDWSDWVDVWSTRAERDWERVKASALNHGGEYSVGIHCKNCYGRKRCPQWLLPLDLVDTSLAPFTLEGALNGENALKALLLADRAEDTAKAVKDILKHYAREEGGIEDGKGKMWAPCKSKGRASFDSNGLERDHPELAQQYIKVGMPFETFRMVKVKT